MSALVTSEIFRLFFNTLTPDEKCSWSPSADFLTTNSNAFISKRKNFLWDFLLHFWNVHEIENILKKKEE